MATTIAVGVELYSLDLDPVVARGALYSAAELAAALEHRLPPIVWDDTGRRDAQLILAKAATTTFETGRIREILERPSVIEDWRVGEALAEAFLVDHRSCEFPWPHGRDLRNPSASPAGADLVGFHHRPDGARFAFGEVKTSEQAACPPSVVKGRNGLTRQIETLRDSQWTKDNLVRYLSFRAAGANWQATFQNCAARYLKDSADVSLFGVLVRDVTPDQRDLGNRPQILASGCPTTTSIELRVKYLPLKAISTLAAAISRQPTVGP
jgi:hypothetical protein